MTNKEERPEGWPGVLDLSELNELADRLREMDLRPKERRYHYGEPNPWQPTDVPEHQRNEPVYGRDNPIP